VDFIVNVLKEHERDLDKLITELGTVTEQLGDTGELTGKVEKVEEKINNLQKEVTNLIGYLSTQPKNANPPQQTAKTEPATQPTPGNIPQNRPPIILKCKQWNDFQNLATQAQNISFSYKETEKTFQADALKGNQLITYSGPLPELSATLKIWLAKQLDVPEPQILEGTLNIG
jgi:hypothetical protein